MHCEQVETMLAQLIFGELDGEQKTQLEAHLAECAACTEALSDMRRAADLLKEGVESGQPPVLSAERKAALMKAVGAGHGVKASWHAKPRQPQTLFAKQPKWVRSAVAAAAMLAVIGILAGLFGPMFGKVRFEAKLAGVRAFEKAGERQIDTSVANRVPAKTWSGGDSEQIAGVEVETRPQVLPETPSFNRAPDESAAFTGEVRKRDVGMAGVNGVTIAMPEKSAPAASPATEPPPLVISKLSLGEQGKAGETDHIHGVYGSRGGSGRRQALVRSGGEAPKSETESAIAANPAKPAVGGSAVVTMPVRRTEKKRPADEPDSDRVPLYAKPPADSRSITARTDDTCGPPPPPAPSQRASAEGTPPLPLPVAPQRQTEARADGYTKNDEVAARSASGRAVVLNGPAQGVLGKLSDPGSVKIFGFGELDKKNLEAVPVAPSVLNGPKAEARIFGAHSSEADLQTYQGYADWSKPKAGRLEPPSPTEGAALADDVSTRAQLYLTVPSTKDARIFGGQVVLNGPKPAAGDAVGGKADTKDMKWAGTKEAQTPFSEILIYPSNWKEIVKQGKGSGTLGKLVAPSATPKPVEEEKSGGIGKALSGLIPHGKSYSHASVPQHENEATENSKAATQVESGMGVKLPSEAPGTGDTFGYSSDSERDTRKPKADRKRVDSKTTFTGEELVDYIKKTVAPGTYEEKQPAFIRLSPGEELKQYDSTVALEIKDFPGNMVALRDRVGATSGATAATTMEDPWGGSEEPEKKPAFVRLPAAVIAQEQLEQADEALKRNPNDEAAKAKRKAKMDELVRRADQRMKDLNEIAKQASDAVNRGDLDAALKQFESQPGKSKFPDMPACNELVQKMREVREEAAKPVSGGRAAADKHNEKILDGLKNIRERIGDMEMWLGKAPDKIKWKVENYDKAEIPQIPLVDLPENLEDLVGDLLDQDEETEQAADTTSAVEEALPEGWESQLPVFKALPPNPFVMTASDRLSTFALDVDTASYTLARRFILSGKLPPAASVRPEEFINAFDYNYPKQSGQAFAVYAEGMASPWRPGLVLLKVGVQGRVLGREGRKPAHLVFVIDTSGSMAKADRMPLVQEALTALAGQLGKDDRVSIVTYGTEARLVLEAVPASNKKQIVRTIRAVQCGGSTNLLQGVQLGYSVAQRAFRTGGINRVILCSDGVANVGLTDSQEMLGQVAGFKEQGISFMSIGFGMGSYNDDLMQKLADKGDGSYVFVDTPQEARRVVNEEIAATLQTIGKDAKIQVEFDPQTVRRYRLIGYEKREIADQDFRNDAIDAGEVGSGQSSTALYELELLADEGGRIAGDIGTVFVRYRNTDTDKIEEISTRLASAIIAEREVSESPRLHLAAAVAEFAEILRESEYAKGADLGDVRRVLGEVAVQLPLDRRVAEALDMAEKAR